MNVNFTLPHAPKNSNKNPPDLFTASAFFVLAISGPYITSLAVSLIASFVTLTDATLTAMSQLLYYVFFILAPILLYMRRFPSAVDTLRINPLSGKCAFLCVAAAVVGVFLLNIITAVWLILIESLGGTLTPSALTIPKTASGLMATVIFTAVLPGISEELLFRGVLLSGWEEKGSGKAMIVSAVWFTFIHSSIEGIPAEFLSGIVLAFVVISTDSLIAGMVYHTVHNSLLLILAFVGERSMDAAGLAENTSVSMLASMGGMSGLISLLMPAAFLGTCLVWILKALDKERIRKKQFTFGYPPAPHRDFTFHEYAVMGSGFAIVLILYLANLLEIAGWL